MLTPPYLNYSILHIYNVDKKDIKIDDPDLIGIWEEEDTLLIFFHKRKDKLIADLNLNLHFYTELPYSDWESGKFIKSFKVGKYSIVPVWEMGNFKDHLENTIFIDPSVVFGSGFHPTTRMILDGFDSLSDKNIIKSCIDLGCGSGILGIFAGKKGVKNITSIDNNNLSTIVARKNFQINSINASIIHSDIFNCLPYKSNVVFANLYSNLLLNLFEREEFWMSDYYFLSGFIEKMEHSITSKINSNFKISERRESERWVSILLSKK